MSEGTAGLPVEWVNGNGEARWQPSAFTRTLWMVAIAPHLVIPRWQDAEDRSGTTGPKLYRSENRAIRIGFRQERHVNRKEFLRSPPYYPPQTTSIIGSSIIGVVHDPPHKYGCAICERKVQVSGR